MEKTVIKSESANPSDLLSSTAKGWGSYTPLHEEDRNLTILVTLTKGNRMRYHSHKGRREIWIVASGIGAAVLNENSRNVKEGDVIEISAGIRHTIVAETDLKIIEVQIGDVSAEDKKIYDLRLDYFNDGSTSYSYSVHRD